MHYLYTITDTISNKIYIGQSIKEKERWRQHKYLARQENPIQYIHRAMKKYGINNFIYEVIATCLTQCDADETETQLIKQYDSRNKERGYNMAPGGNVAWQAGLPPEMYPMFGKHHTEESKKKISESNLGKIMSNESRQKMSESMQQRLLIGWKPASNDEISQKISKSHIGKIVSEETKEKIRKYHTGLIHSEETKNKMSEAKIGKKKSKEHRKNISLAKRIFDDAVENTMFELKQSGKTYKEISQAYNCSIPCIARACSRVSKIKNIPIFRCK